MEWRFLFDRYLLAEIVCETKRREGIKEIVAKLARDLTDGKFRVFVEAIREQSRFKKPKLSETDEFSLLRVRFFSCCVEQKGRN